MSYLLSIEVRLYDDGTQSAGEIVALEQATAPNVWAVVDELKNHSGKRLAERIEFPRGIPLERAIEADPR